MMQIIFGTDPIKFPLTGIGRYTYELSRCLQDSLEVSNILFLHGYHLSCQIPSPRETASISQVLRRRVQKNNFALALYQLIAPWLKARIIRKYPDAIYHSPNFYLPPNINRCLATFHDLSVFTWPECHPVERVRFMQKELLLTLKRANILITNSEFTRLELAKYFNISVNKVYVAKLASSADFYPRSAEALRPFLAPLGLRANHYCLFTGSIEPRKNIGVLLDAYARLPLVLRRTIPLVISGFEGWSTEGLYKRFESAKSAGWLHYLGYAKARVLPYIVAGARSFLFASLYEGFGLPVLEAMASGIPVVCSNSASLPELAGNCALMCAAQDVDSLTEMIQKSIEDKTWRNQAKINGINQAKQFSWQRCAQETLSAYRQI